MRSRFKDSVASLNGVGPKLVKKLTKIGLDTLIDLLWHLPSRYVDKTQITQINKLIVGNYTGIVGTIIATNVHVGRSSILVCKVRDGSGAIDLKFFNFFPNQVQALKVGELVHAYGEIKFGSTSLEIIHPEYKLIKEFIPNKSLSPIYPTTEGISQLVLSKIIMQALHLLTPSSLPELLPKEYNEYSLTLVDALLLAHNPTKEINLDDNIAVKRIVFEELLAHNLSMLRVKNYAQQEQALKLKSDEVYTPALLKSLPFSLTNAQQRVIDEIKKDLILPYPMLRLVQGDVGSGKTLVAAITALQAIGSGAQVAFMAPTELLAEQHVSNFEQWFLPLGLKTSLLTGKVKGKARANILKDLADGSCNLLIGTHAIFQQDIIFHNLALVIIDEQHRFGVHQRLLLREKGSKLGKSAHQLVMTATPIPRTLAMTAYADLNISVIDEMPKGRKPIVTVAIASSRREEVIDRVKKTVVADKRQVYWVCTLIEESETLQCQAAAKTADELQLALPEFRIGLLHGRMKADEKKDVMNDFKMAKIDLLVATTVIEVGVDVPNASLMIIENSERLGLSQLHQLRGRVGRGNIASFCLLMYNSPLSVNAQQRLEVMRQTNDGFIIAQKDLEIRGPGELLGTKQTGVVNMLVADLIRDQDIIPVVQSVAVKIEDPELIDAIIDRWLPNTKKYLQA